MLVFNRLVPFTSDSLQLLAQTEAESRTLSTLISQSPVNKKNVGVRLGVRNILPRPGPRRAGQIHYAIITDLRLNLGVLLEKTNRGNK